MGSVFVQVISFDYLRRIFRRLAPYHLKVGAAAFDGCRRTILFLDHFQVVQRMSSLSAIVVSFDYCRIFRLLSYLSASRIFRPLLSLDCCRIFRSISCLSTVGIVSFDGWHRIFRRFPPYLPTIVSFNGCRIICSGYCCINRLLPCISTIVVSFDPSSIAVSVSHFRTFRALSYRSIIVVSRLWSFLFRVFRPLSHLSTVSANLSTICVIFRRLLATYLSTIGVVPCNGWKRICRRLASSPLTVCAVYFGQGHVFQQLPPYNTTIVMSSNCCRIFRLFSYLSSYVVSFDCFRIYRLRIVVSFDYCRTFFDFCRIIRLFSYLSTVCAFFDGWHCIFRRLASRLSTVQTVFVNDWHVSFGGLRCIFVVHFDGWHRIFRRLAPYFCTVGSVSSGGWRPIVRLFLYFRPQYE